MPAGKAVGDVLENKGEDVEETNKSSTVVNGHRKPLTDSIGKSIHNTWQRMGCGGVGEKKVMFVNE